MRYCPLPSFSLTTDAVLFDNWPICCWYVCLVLVDDRNLRVADFAQFWAIAKVYPHSLFHNLCEYFFFLFLLFMEYYA